MVKLKKLYLKDSNKKLIHKDLMTTTADSSKNNTPDLDQPPVQEEHFLLYSSTRKVKDVDPDIEEKVWPFLKEKLKYSLRSENLIVLSGAGSSMGYGGKSMSEIWDIVENDMPTFSNILEEVQYTAEQRKLKNLEHLLSILQIEKQSLENKKEDTSEITKNIDSIESKILLECSFDLPESAPHDFFLRKLLKARKNIDPRIRIFNLNYDISFEIASDRIGAVLIDGFSFSQRQVFNPSTYDLDIVYREKSRIHSEESFFTKILHLYKMHGSVSWSKDANGIISKEKDPVTDPKKAVLIYPNSSKYEKSYEMPFFELVSKFQNSLRKENTTLLIIGYSFNDDHINRLLREAIKSNSNLEVFVVKKSLSFANPLLNEFKVWIDKGLNDLHLVAAKFEDFVKNIPEVVFDTDSNRDNIIKN